MQVLFLQMTKTPKAPANNAGHNPGRSPARTKDPAAVKIGKRIAQARKMAGFSSAKKFREKLPQWPHNRLSWYEAGYSMPHPDDVETIARLTGASPCWIQFGLGPIRSGKRDLQAVRHQNLVFLQREAGEDPIVALGPDSEPLSDYIDNPFQHIDDRLARRIEQAGGRPRKWLDEQHVESDGLCSSFPDDLHELMTLYSEMDARGRRLLFELANSTARHWQERDHPDP
jgi:transcriptional regulator with XRE-family HTH domain